MAFRFALAPLLRLRKSMEHQRTLELQEASLQVRRAKETIAQLDRQLEESAQADAAALCAGRTAADLQFATLLREQLHLYREQLQYELRRLEAIRDQAVGAYQHAYRDREVLETLRLRQRHEYQLEQSRRQQRELDAAYLLQRWHQG